MNLEDALYRAITGGLDRADERAPFAERLADIAKHAGSWKAAAALIGVTDSTVRKWRRGASGGKGIARPKGASLSRVGDAQRRARLSADRERHLRSKAVWQTFEFGGEVSISNDERNRNIPGSYIDVDVVSLDGVIDAYLSGDDAGAADAFEELLAEGYFQIADDGATIDVGNVETLEFGGPS